MIIKKDFSKKQKIVNNNSDVVNNYFNLNLDFNFNPKIEIKIDFKSIVKLSLIGISAVYVTSCMSVSAA